MFSCLVANVNHLPCLWKSHLSQKALSKWFHMSLLTPEDGTDSTSETLRVASEIKKWVSGWRVEVVVVVGVNDLTEILLMTRQKLVFSVGASRFNVVSQADRR